ncbi:MAG: hypothetical protein R8K47_01120, partial [Mariprofundaceae bacterium]
MSHAALRTTVFLIVAGLMSLAVPPTAGTAAPRWHPVHPTGPVLPSYLDRQACSSGLASCVLMQDP